MAYGNPAIQILDRSEPAAEYGNTMTVNGTVNKVFILLGCCVLTAALAWGQVANNPASVGMFIAIGAIGGLVVALITCFNPTAARYTAVPYALFEGLFIGAISAVIQARFPNTPIVMQAAGLTFGTLGALLVAYRTGAIKVTDKFRAGIMAATGAVCLLYLTTFILGLFGVRMPYIHDAGAIGIGISAVVVVIAALNLVLDFDFIDRGAQHGLPREMEWYGAFGLMVTLVWLYLEILKLLAKLNKRD